MTTTPRTVEETPAPLTPGQLAEVIDHALLRPDLTPEQVATGVAEAAACQVASVCVRPSDVADVARLLRGHHTKVGTVIGFPHGTTSTAAKVAEARAALQDGAVELDMVLNIGRLRGGDLAAVVDDIAAVVAVAHSGGALVKVILETALLDDTQKVDGCRAAQQAGADYVKTSTGFASGGATVADVALLRETVGETMGVKASGGIADLATAQALLAAGANRLGTSQSVALLEQARAAASRPGHGTGAKTPGAPA